MNLLRRVISAAVLLALVAGCLVAGRIPVLVLVVAAAAVASYELWRLGAGLELTPPPWLLLPLTISLSVRAFLPHSWPVVELAISVAVVAGLVGAVVSATSFSRFSVGVAAGCYAGLGLGYFGALYVTAGGSHLGLRLVVLALIGPVVGDTAAYFVGSAIGKHPFFASISPKKSIEGACAAALATVIVYAAVSGPLVHIAWWQGAVLGAVVTVAAQAGDLAESALKRQAGVKDSSTLIPGHGGLLDRLDSLLLVAPVVYWVARIVSPS